MKKIVHFIDSDDPGGAETLIIDLARALKKHGYRSEVMFFGNSWLEEYCGKYGIPFHIVPYESLYRSKYTLPLFVLLFPWYLKKYRIDFIHTHLFDTVFPASLAARFLGKPHIATLHDRYSIENSRFRMAVLKLAAWMGSKLVPVSKDINRLLVSKGGLNESQTRTIYNGVDLQKYESTPRPEKIEGVRPSADVFIFICVARLVEVKGHNVLFDAFEKLVSQDLPVKLLLAGDGPLMESYSNRVKARHLDQSVSFLGQRSDVVELLKFSDCFVLVSESEGLSCSIIEAMAAGLPVIATNVGGNPELIDSGYNGCLVAVGDVDSISRQMAAMVNNRVRAGEMGQASKAKVLKKFSIETMVGEYIKLYTNLSVPDGN